MFGKRKRPWKRYAKIKRIEMNNGDVKYWTSDCGYPEPRLPTSEDRFRVLRCDFESLDEAADFLDAWWAEWWPKQIKKSRRA